MGGDVGGDLRLDKLALKDPLIDEVVYRSSKHEEAQQSDKSFRRSSQLTFNDEDSEVWPELSHGRCRARRWRRLGDCRWNGGRERGLDEESKVWSITAHEVPAAVSKREK